MMGHKHLHELLREEQEPFHLNNYIADRRCQLGRKTALQLRKREPSFESVSAPPTTRSFCIKQVCLFAFQDSPDVRRSPLLDLPAPVRVQKHSSSSKSKPDSSEDVGFGLFGSFLKRLKDRSSRTRRREIGSGETTELSPAGRSREKEVANDVVGYEKCFPCSCDNGRRHSSADWSEMATSCSSRSVGDSGEIENGDFASYEKCFCSSPFHFSLQASPSPFRRSPDFLSPAKSPSRRLQQEKEKSEEIVVEEEEQCSPVSVLDHPFEDEEECNEEDDYDLECSFASVERAKHQLLQKLRRFETLAGLDPIELEKHKLEEQFDEDNDDENDDFIVKEQENSTKDMIFEEIYNHLGIKKIPFYMKRLVSDLIEEEKNKNNEEHELEVAKRVRKRLDLWKNVESNTIDMMVEWDLRREKSEGWKKFDKEKVMEIGREIEVFLVEELAYQLVASF